MTSEKVPCKHPYHDLLGRYCTCQPFSRSRAVVRQRKVLSARAKSEKKGDADWSPPHG